MFRIHYRLKRTSSIHTHTHTRKHIKHICSQGLVWYYELQDATCQWLFPPHKVAMMFKEDNIHKVLTLVAGPQWALPKCHWRRAQHLEVCDVTGTNTDKARKGKQRKRVSFIPWWREKTNYHHIQVLCVPCSHFFTKISNGLFSHPLVLRIMWRTYTRW